MASTTRACALGLLLLACHSPPAAPPPDASPPVDAGVAPTAEAPAPSTVHQLLASIVITLTGTAEVQRAGSQTWVALKIGDPVHAGDVVRTAADSEVSLSFGSARLHLQDESSVELKFLDPHRVRVAAQGEVEAAAPDGTAKVELEGPGDSITTVSFGRAVLHTSGNNAGAVAALEGKVTVSSSKGEVELSEGALSVLHAGRAPTSAGRAPRRARLSVNWPPQGLTNQATLKLTGQSGPWTRVLVQGHRVETAEDGAFHADVALHRGKQKVRVVAIDVLGHRTRQARWITLDPDAPNIQAEVDFQ